MATTGIRRNDLLRTVLSEILEDGVGDHTDMALFLYDDFGQLLLSSTTEDDLNTNTVFSMDSVQQAAQAALGIASSPTEGEKRCLVDTVHHQDKVMGVLVGWLGMQTIESQTTPLCKTVMRITRRRIEDLLILQEEMNALSEEIIDRYREIGLIHNLSTQLAGLEDIEHVYQVILEQTLEIVEADRGYIFKLDKTSDSLRVVHCLPEPDSIIYRPIRIGQGIIGEVAETGDSTLMERNGSPIWSTEAKSTLSPPLMCCALHINQEVLGVIAVTREATKREFASGDLKILESAALQSAAAMKNLTLLHELSQSNCELRETLTELQRTQAQLIQSQKVTAVGELVAGVAHDLNNPLTTVIGFSELLCAEATDENQRSRLKIIGQEAERAASIVRNLLTFSRKRPLQKEAIHVNKVVQAVIQLRTQQSQASSVEFATDLAIDLPDTMADFHQLQQVLLNLVTNAEQAIEQTGQKGKIELQTRQVCADAPNTSNQVEIIVTDNGPGMPPDVAEQIFEPFFTTKEEGKGTGLGLSICMKIIDAHDGTLDVESRVGEGTRFFIRLPGLLPSDCPSHSQEERWIKTVADANILVVDDEPALCEVLRSSLEDIGGYHVETASNGVEALEKVQGGSPDLVLTDIHMPKLDGISLYQELQQTPTFHGKVIFMTGSLAATEVSFEAVPKNVPCVLKPFKIRDMLQQIQTVLEPV